MEVNKIQKQLLNWASGATRDDRYRFFKQFLDVLPDEDRTDFVSRVQEPNDVEVDFDTDPGGEKSTSENEHAVKKVKDNKPKGKPVKKKKEDIVARKELLGSSDSDSDSAQKTKESKKTRIKREPEECSSKKDEETDSRLPVANTSKSFKVNPKLEPPDAPVSDEEDDIINFLTPPSADIVEGFAVSPDEVRTVLMPRMQEPNDIEVDIDTDLGVENSTQENEQKMKDNTRKGKGKPVKKSKEDIAAMKELLGSSDSDSDSAQKKRESRKNLRKRETKESTPRKRQESTPRKRQESTTRQNEESTPSKRRESTTRQNEESTPSKRQESTTRQNEESTPSKRRESSTKKSKGEESTPRKDEESSATENEENSSLLPVSNTSKSWKEDPKLKPDAAVVKLERLTPAIVKSVNEAGYVVLKEYRKLKRCTLNQLEKVYGKDSSDSDSSTASNDSLKALERELKKLTRNSIISTIKHKKKTNPGNILEKKTRKSRGRKKATEADDDELESSDSGSDTSLDVRKCEAKPEPKLVDSDIVSCSASEDIDPDSDESTRKNKQRPSRSNPSKSGDGKRKIYKQATISCSDSDEKDHMRALLGSDSDSDNKKSKKTKASGPKKDKENSDTDSDFISTKKKGTKRALKKSDSEVSLITVKSSSSDDSDSDSDFVKTKKKSSKRRRDSSSESNKKKKKRRRRIVNNDSEDSSKPNSNGSDIEEISQEPGSSQKGRKNIRKIMSTKELAKTTKEAEKEEEERRKRLADKQKMFNGIHKAPESDKIQRLVLDVDPETKEPAIEVEPAIVGHLKPHQAEGIKFMYNACFESIDMIKQNKVPGGCILAHCMGLGKTLQTIAFVHTLLTNQICGIKTALVICPLSTVNNWFLEFRKWTEDAESIKIHKLYEAKNTVASRMDYFKTWQRRGGVGLLHYDMFRRLADPKGKSKMKTSLKNVVQETLLDPGPDIVICDEGHLLKNCKSMLSLAVSNIRTHRRIVLTGTPLQNNLVEYHTMMNFVKPNLLGSLPEFTNRFVNPIKNGQHADSTEYDVKTMKRRAHVLHRKLEGCVQRRDYSILAPYLPPKYEYIINIKLSEKQEALYKEYLDSVVDPDPLARRRNLLKYYAELVKVWSHPIALTMRRAKEEGSVSDSDEAGSIKDFVVDDKSSSSGSDTGEGGNSDEQKSAANGSNKKRTTRAQTANDPGWEKGIINLDDAISAGGWWNSVFKTKDEMYDVSLSGKLIILQEILKTCETIGDKVLVFSQFLTSLDIIEEFLEDWDKEAVEQLKEKDQLTFPLSSGPQQGRWRKNIEYFRIDGQTKAGDRQRDCDKFNKKSSLSKAKLFLISTRAGGLGINLFGANRVVIFDASWNPSQDMQSIFRVYRFGQEKPCYIYRLIARGTMEEKILRRQITKLSLSSRVVDEHQIERHFKFDDVNEMYRYDEEDPSTKDAVLAVPKDRLLADLLMSHRDWIRSYEEFDSLLENKPDEGLSTEEKELAWQEYRIESERQRQSNVSSSSVTTEAETYLKVKARLQVNHPHATEQQIDIAANTCLQVIDKIRRLVQNSHTNPQFAPLMEVQLTPLKQWLQVSVNPRAAPADPVPPNASILPPIPEELYQADPVPSFQQYLPRFPQMQFQPRYSQPVRPPMTRNIGPPGLRPIDPGRTAQLVQNNFRNIASSTLASMSRNYHPQQMNGQYE